MIAGHMVQGMRVTNLVFTSQRLDRTWATGVGGCLEGGAWPLRPVLTLL